jgi:hypothetical protein
METGFLFFEWFPFDIRNEKLKNRTENSRYVRIGSKLGTTKDEGTFSADFFPFFNVLLVAINCQKRINL